MASVFSRIGNFLTALRQWTVNLFTLAFLIYLVVIAVALSRQLPPTVDPEGRVLIIAPEGTIVDQEIFARTVGFSDETQITYRDLVRVLRAAREDERLAAVTIDFSNAGFSGPTAVLALAEELAAFKAAGKPLIAYGDIINTGAYLLAAQADEVYLHPAGALAISGLGGQRPFFNELTRKLKVTVHDFSQGEFKSASESLTRDSMSDKDREQTSALLHPLWDTIKARIASARELSPDGIQAFADEQPVFVAGGGAYANLEAAQVLGLIDGLKTYPEYRAFMRERFGTDDEAERETYPHITAGAYLAQLEQEAETAEDAVAVVFVQGVIMRGEQEPGTAGADDIVGLIRQAYEDDATKALVLRVNSPGGTVLASEMIRDAILEAQQRGLPVVTSMGDIAASGGMWVSAPADRILAAPSTITGSIGVALAVPTFEDSLEHIGVHFDGFRTSRYAGWSPLLNIDDAVKTELEQATEDSYQRFIKIVAEGRGRSVAEIEGVAGGRVWLGTAALENGLIDAFGDLEDAVEQAAELAALTDYRVDYRIVEPSPGVRLLRDLLQQVPLRVDDGYLQMGGRLSALLEPLLRAQEPRIMLMCEGCELSLTASSNQGATAYH